MSCGLPEAAPSRWVGRAKATMPGCPSGAPPVLGPFSDLPHCRSRHLFLVALPAVASAAVMPFMGTKSREGIWGSTIRGAKMSAETARQRAREGASEADRAEAYAWSVQMEGFGGPAQP